MTRSAYQGGKDENFWLLAIGKMTVETLSS